MRDVCSTCITAYCHICLFVAWCMAIVVTYRQRSTDERWLFWFAIAILLLYSDSAVLCSTRNALAYDMHRMRHIRKDSPRWLKFSALRWIANKRVARDGSSKIEQRIVIIVFVVVVVVVIVDKQCDLIFLFYFFIRSVSVCYACGLSGTHSHCKKAAMSFLDSINVKYLFINLFINLKSWIVRTRGVYALPLYCVPDDGDDEEDGIRSILSNELASCGDGSSGSESIYTFMDFTCAHFDEQSNRLELLSIHSILRHIV